MTTHSRLFSPSAASRWLVCPGSAELNAGLKDKGSSYAAEGTLLHEFCENNFEQDAKVPINFDVLDEKIQHLAKEALEMAHDLKAFVGAGHVHLEAKVSLLNAEDCFGTVDLVFYNPKTKHLCIADYKFGYNPVDAEMNPQLLIYALGARRLFAKEGVDNITLAVIQPKIDSKKCDIFTLSQEDLNDWNNNVFLPAHTAILDGSNTLTPGESQCRWCKAKATCPALQSEVTDALNAEGPHSTIEISEWLGKLKMIRSFCDAIEAEAMGHMEEGEDVPGFKLVRKRTRRRWTDPEAAPEGYSDDQESPEQFCSTHRETRGWIDLRP